ncbi:MAG: cyclase family protein [Chloroflexi bacterium]|nr:cyclase family protein [Chloroflexota bacterium]
MSKPWWPSRYGQADQKGTLNEITPEKLVQAAQLVKLGKTYDLGHVLDEHVPAFPGRSFHQRLLTAAHQVNRRRPDAGTEGWGENNVNWIIDELSGTSQLGTHLDGLNHLQIGDRTYNGYRLADIVEEYGTNKLGIDEVPQIATRGVLVDVATLKGVRRLDAGRVITVADVESALDRQAMRVARGDALLLHTGWGDLWMQDNEAYLSGEPGPGMEVALWLVEQGVALTGCDTWSYGPVPPEDPAARFAVPQTLNVRHGMFIAENLVTSELARDGVYEFMFVLTHARLRGATGAWVAPVAIV